MFVWPIVICMATDNMCKPCKLVLQPLQKIPATGSSLQTRRDRVAIRLQADLIEGARIGVENIPERERDRHMIPDHGLGNTTQKYCSAQPGRNQPVIDGATISVGSIECGPRMRCKAARLTQILSLCPVGNDITRLRGKAYMIWSSTSFPWEACWSKAERCIEIVTNQRRGALRGFSITILYPLDRALASFIRSAACCHVVP